MTIADEFVDADLGDQRLNKRVASLAENFEKHHGESIAISCGDWGTTKAAYRFFDNPSFSEQQILEPHIRSTVERVKAQSERIIVIHDTTEFNYSHHQQTDGLGYLMSYTNRRTKSKVDTRGILMHASMALTLNGVPLGLLCQKQWVRAESQRRKIRNSKKNFTRVPIEEKESFKWLEGISQSISSLQPQNLIHVCDRDADIFELFVEAQELKTHFVVRAVHNRCLARKGAKIYSKISQMPSTGDYSLKIQASRNRAARTAEIQIRFYKVKVVPPIAKAKDFCPVDLYVISAREKSSKTLPESDRINWKLLTDLPVQTFDEAVEKIKWYQARWNIEIYFKILKSGCGLDRSRLRHGDRIKKFNALMSVVAWRIFWITKTSRESPDSKPTICFSKIELKAISDLEYFSGRKRLTNKSSLKEYVVALARLGGYLARKSDPAPGPLVMWRALKRLNDMTTAVMTQSYG